MLYMNFVDFLKTGAHLQNATEDMQIMWMEKEPAIEDFAKTGNLPDCNIESGGENTAYHIFRSAHEAVLENPRIRSIWAQVGC